MAEKIGRDWALFLDLDGTLIDIAATPDGVTTPAGLTFDLVAIVARLNGALAIVSGRTFDDIDRILSPLRLSGAAEHGAWLRGPAGQIQKLSTARSIPETWRHEISSTSKRWPGVLVEEKAESIAVHYRLAAQFGEDVFRLLATVAERDPGNFEVLRAKMACEIRPRDATKGLAVRRLMAFEPFRGRLPVFVGDDITDEDGMEAARQLGGFGLRVDAAFEGQPANVRAWLARNAAEPNGGGAS